MTAALLPPIAQYKSASDMPLCRALTTIAIEPIANSIAVPMIVPKGDHHRAWNVAICLGHVNINEVNDQQATRGFRCLLRLSERYRFTF